MSQLLKKLQTPPPIWYGLVIVGAALMWFLPDIFGVTYLHKSYPFVVLEQYVLFELPAFWAHFVQFFCALIICYWTATWCDRYNILPARSAVIFMVPLIVMSGCWRIQFFDASTISFLLFACSVSQILSTYKRSKECVSQAFNIGLFMVCALIFDRSYIWLSIPLIIGFAIFNSGTLRTTCALLAGILMPIALIVGSFILSDQTAELAQFTTWPQWYASSKIHEWVIPELAYAGTLMLLYTVSLIAYLTSSTIYGLKIRLIYIFLHIIFIISIAVTFVISILDSILLLPTLFAAIVICFYFTTSFRSKVANACFYLLLVATLACRIALLFFNKTL